MTAPMHAGLGREALYNASSARGMAPVCHLMQHPFTPQLYDFPLHSHSSISNATPTRSNASTIKNSVLRIFYAFYFPGSLATLYYHGKPCCVKPTLFH